MRGLQLVYVHFLKGVYDHKKTPEGPSGKANKITQRVLFQKLDDLIYPILERID